MRDGTDKLPHLTHTWMEKMVQKPSYIRRKWIQRRGDGRKKEKAEERKKARRNTTVTRKNSKLLITLLGYD